MKIQNVLQHLDVDELGLTAEDTGSYNAYTIPDDTVVQMSDPAYPDITDLHTISYVQVYNPTDDKGKLKSGPLEIICQVEGMSDEPINVKMDTDVAVRIYKQIL